MSSAISTIISNDKIMVYLELWSVLMFLLTNNIEIQLLYDIKWFYWFSLTKNLRSCLDGMYFVDTTNYIIVV